MRKILKKFKGNNLIWIIVLVILLYVFLGGLVMTLIYEAIRMLSSDAGWSDAVNFINDYYTNTIGAVLTLVVVCLIVKKNRFILRSFLPAGMGRNHRELVVEDTYEPTQNNTPKMLLLGLLLGFLSNFACIVCALIHGDIKLYLDFSAGQIPVMLYGFLMVFIQSSSEELWCRGYMYERINIHYPLWVSILVNGAFFGVLHCFNDGATVLAIADIIICGISFSLLRWYSGSIWLVMGIHTMWNFTQNLLFGLPNSGLVSEVSVFHMDAVNAVSNLVYSYEFGVEGAIPAVISDSLMGIVALLLARRDGRLGELFMSYEKKAALSAEVEKTTSETSDVGDGAAE